MTNIEKYKQIMLCIKHRIHYIQTKPIQGKRIIISRPNSPFNNTQLNLPSNMNYRTEDSQEINTAWDVDLEEKALQIRKITELIATASLVVDSKIYEKCNKELQNKSSLAKTLHRIEKEHRRFYPEPFIKSAEILEKLATIDIGISLYGKQRIRPDKYLRYEIPENASPTIRSQRLINVYNKSSDILHSNPFDGTEHQKLEKKHNRITEWTNLIINLLNIHSIRLKDEPTEYVLHTYMDKITEDNLNNISHKVNHVITRS